jgi:D-lactate dehydrogenase
MKTLVYSIHGFDQASLEKAAKGKHNLTFTDQSLNASTASLANDFEAIALFTSDMANGKVLELLHDYHVKYIALRSVGYDYVDIAKAKSLGIKVANVPAYSPYAIAEHALTLLLALNRKLILSQYLMRIGDYRLDQLIGSDLHGKTIGIIGTGKIGAAFASIMNGFGCELLAYDVIQNEALQSKLNLSYCSLDYLCKNADVISVHCPLNKATQHLFNYHTFLMMKKNVIFINTARGGIVNTVDLIKALEENRLHAVGLDVYEFEKPIFFKNNMTVKIYDDLFLKLKSFSNVLITGHQAFLTNEALEGIAATVINNLDEWQKNKQSLNDL